MAKQAIVVPFDPWSGCDLSMAPLLRAAVHEAELPPQQWGDLLPRQRELLGGLAVYVLTAHGPFNRDRLLYLRHRLLETLRATHDRTEKKGGYCHDLEPFFVSDDDVRVLWRRLDLALQNPPFSGGSLLDELLSTLAAGGDLLTSLRARRDAIDLQISRLQRLGAAS